MKRESRYTFFRHCKKCDGRFQPSGRDTYLCNNCRKDKWNCDKPIDFPDITAWCKTTGLRKASYYYYKQQYRKKKGIKYERL